jgi:hypothetical protein
MRFVCVRQAALLAETVNLGCCQLKDTLLGCEVKPEVVYGNEKAVQSRVQA